MQRYPVTKQLSPVQIVTHHKVFLFFSLKCHFFYRVYISAVLLVELSQRCFLRIMLSVNYYVISC